ncbi:MAG: SDR family oxidoreductase [Kofleriaceae bacterium]
MSADDRAAAPGAPEGPVAPAPDDFAARCAAAAALLEEIGADLRILATLDEPLRVRLAAAAGAVSRPDRYTRKALGKALIRERVKQKRAADSALLDATGIRALRREPVFRTPLPMPRLPLEEAVRDEPAPGEVVDAWAAAEAERAGAPTVKVAAARFCYVCKTEFHELHHFYDQMCIPCGDFNFGKRSPVGDLRGRVYLVTGGRVKIGYQAAIMLLRAGAEVIVATRFPHDGARRFAREPDAASFAGRLHVYGIDLRHTPSVEALCAHLAAGWGRLDGIINNACQTVRRPSGWYDHVLAGEHVPVAELPPLERAALARYDELRGGAPALGVGGAGLAAVGASPGPAGLWRSAILSQVPLLAEDHERGSHLFPTGRLDADLQQVDLRDTNSWRMALADVPTAELLEVHLVNAVAPFVLNAKLRPLLAAVPTRDAHVVNVSAMEGQFYRRWKTDKHPHTNMAKAALNMMTRTSAADYVKAGIHMNSVDTGWVTDEDPLAIATRKQAIHGFHPPLDIVDGAARIVDPIFDGLATGTHAWGLFLKDYRPAPW